MPKGIGLKNLQRILTNQRLRRNLAYEDPLWFSLIYLRHHFEHPFAPFHMEMFHIIRQPKYRFVAMMAFRESGKSTIMNMVNVLWSILGKPQKKLAVVMSQTQEQAKNQFGNIKDELVANELLREDFGPYAENEAEWKKMSLELEYHGSKILSVSLEQSVRGFKYHQHRPDLIVCDDIEDYAMEAADRPSPYSRFMSEVMTLGNSETKIFVLGNLISKHSFLLQLKKEIEAKKIGGIFRAYPLLDDEKRILWPEKFPSLGHIEELKKRFTRKVWEREFLLKAVTISRQTALMRIHLEEGIEKKEKPDQQPDPPLQTALIPQMAEFKISTPLTMNETPLDFLNEDDPRYLRYFGNLDPDELLQSHENCPTDDETPESQ